MPSLNKSSRESGQMQDMYRRTLSAYWSAQPGDLKADECIEDIFAGGDGWGDKNRPTFAPPERPRVGRQWKSRRSGGERTESRNEHSSERPTRTRTLREGEHHRQSSHGSIAGERTSLEQHARSMKAEAASTRNDVTSEVNEFDIREDLRSWKSPGGNT